MNSIWIKPLLWGLLAIFISGGIGWYGHTRYEAGVAFKQAEMDSAIVQIDKDNVKKKQIADQEYSANQLLQEKRILDAKTANDKLVANANSLRNQINILKHATSEATKDSTKSNGPGEAGFDVLGQCVDNLQGMAIEAGRLADKVTGLQEQIKILEKANE